MAVCKLTFELPAELVSQLGSPEEAAARAKEALVLELLREARIGQSRAAELLSITRSELLELMLAHQVPSGPRTLEDADQELETARRLARGDRSLYSHDFSAAIPKLRVSAR